MEEKETLINETTQPEKSTKEKILGTFREVVPFVLILIVIIAIRTFIATPVRVNGTSMLETLHHNEIILLEKHDKILDRFDVVVIQHGDERIVKRVIGLPGESVQYISGVLYINNNYVEDPYAKKTPDYTYEGIIPKDEYFVLGDNRTGSMDSRVIGTISYSNILGTTRLRLFPFKSFGTF